MICKPIPFIDRLVQAIADGRKTVTRRVVRGTPLTWLDAGFDADYVASQANGLSPYGYAGDQLWVRETFAFGRGYDGLPPRDVQVDVPTWYRADGSCSTGLHRLLTRGKWRPPMFMPRWASRTTLDVVDVRPERLQDITEADAVAEGFDYEVRDPGIGDGGRPGVPWSGGYAGTPLHAFELTWDTINAHRPARSWACNPWIWRIQFTPVPMETA